MFDNMNGFTHMNWKRKYETNDEPHFINNTHPISDIESQSINKRYRRNDDPYFPSSSSSSSSSFLPMSVNHNYSYFPQQQMSSIQTMQPLQPMQHMQGTDSSMEIQENKPKPTNWLTSLSQKYSQTQQQQLQQQIISQQQQQQPCRSCLSILHPNTSIKCNYCEHLFCQHSCLRSCDGCQGKFCMFCVSTDFSQRYERLLCVDCQYNHR